MSINIKISVVFCLFIFLYNSQNEKFTFAFGSCAHQDEELKIFDLIQSNNPNLFIFLGDNIYGDTRNMDTLQAKYDKLADNPFYQKLQAKTKIAAVWDDHDYGENDAGKYYPFKKESKKIFLKFFNEKKLSKRRLREGNYAVFYKKVGHIKIQFILLDCRYFRSDLMKLKHQEDAGIDDLSPFFYPLSYGVQQNADSTILGAKQWKWLTKILHKKADIRFICSSTQVLPSYNGYESWANFPKELDKLKNLLVSSNAINTFILSGDVHYAELSEQELSNGQKIFDMTSSGLSETWEFATPNKNRVGEAIMENNFGLIEIDAVEKRVLMKIIDNTNKVRLDKIVQIQ